MKHTLVHKRETLFRPGQKRGHPQIIAAHKCQKVRTGGAEFTVHSTAAATTSNFRHSDRLLLHKNDPEYIIKDIIKYYLN